MSTRVLLLYLTISFSFLITCKNNKKTNLDYISTEIAKIPSSFPVNFALLTEGDWQFIAYYDTAHQMILVKRNFDDNVWEFQKLDSKIAWDSHNYLSLAIDKKGIIHLVGNMHSSPLVYFRSSKPYDIKSMKATRQMTGREEDVTTYPEFIKHQNGDLIFHYRFGVSGSGYEIYNKWDSDKLEWKRLLDRPLIDGEGKMNAYMQGPLLGPDRYYHLLWVWRNTPDCATNHTLSYARSRDLVNWESIRSEKVELPITIADSVLQVDTTPPYGGLINIGIKIGFDASNKVLAGYHKYDKKGNTQLFIARFEGDKWRNYQLTNWDYRWDFKGYGTIKNELLIESPKSSPNKNELVFAYHHLKYGDGQVIVDNKTLSPIRTEPFVSPYPNKIDSLISNYPGMVVNKVFDSGKSKNGKNYLLRWETLPPNRDNTPDDMKIPPSKLELIEY